MMFSLHSDRKIACNIIAGFGTIFKTLYVLICTVGMKMACCCGVHSFLEMVLHYFHTGKSKYHNYRFFRRENISDANDHESFPDENVSSVG